MPKEVKNIAGGDSKNSRLPDTVSLGNLKVDVDNTCDKLNSIEAVKKIITRAVSFWKSDEENQQSIANRLGWLTLPEAEKVVPELHAFAEEIISKGFKSVVLLGMGGSSLAAEVAKATFSSPHGYPAFYALDNTSPDAVAALENKIDVTNTLFIVASKSGSTVEPNCFFQHFFSLVKEKKENAGENFIAITDEGTPLVKLTAENGFRKTFINPSDIGGRFSVLSYFGLVPMALMGLDLRKILQSALEMHRLCATIDIKQNPGAYLGAVLGCAQQHGRDKVTLILSPPLHAFGLWLEQLLAESTGKEGRGLVPVYEANAGNADDYSSDRVFVYTGLAGVKEDETESKLAALAAAGHPVLKITLSEKEDLGGEFFRWEFATAVAGKVLNVNPFNEPNVAESKAYTNDLLKELEQKGAFNKPDVFCTEHNVTLYKTEAVAIDKVETPADCILKLLKTAKAPDYVSVLCYSSETDKRNETLREAQAKLRNTLKVAVTTAYGPRYLHSTGQLHKGGPNEGIYVLIYAKPAEERSIPGQPFNFEQLQQAQALGDFRALNKRGRRAVMIEAEADFDTHLKQLLNVD